MTLLNHRLFLADTSIKPFEVDNRVDLLAPNVPIVASNKYVCWSRAIPRGQVLIVKGVAPYAMQRIEPGSADESFQMIQPSDGNGFFAFEPTINDVALPAIIEVAYTTPRNLDPANNPPANLNDKDKQRARGWSQLSLNPREEAHREWQNPLYAFAVPGGATLKILFSVLPPSLTDPLPADGRYQISVSAVKRVDFAGAYVVGEQMAQQSYDDLVAELREEQKVTRRATTKARKGES